MTRRPFTQIDNALIERPVVSDGAMRLYLALKSHDWDGTGCWPSRRRLAEFMGCSMRTVTRRTSELVAAGLIVVDQEVGPGRTNLYWLGPMAVDDPDQAPSHPCPAPPGRPRPAKKTQEKETQRTRRARASTAPSPPSAFGEGRVISDW